MFYISLWKQNKTKQNAIPTKQNKNKNNQKNKRPNVNKITTKEKVSQTKLMNARQFQAPNAEKAFVRKGKKNQLQFQESSGDPCFITIIT